MSEAVKDDGKRRMKKQDKTFVYAVSLLVRTDDKGWNLREMIRDAIQDYGGGHVTMAGKIVVSRVGIGRRSSLLSLPDEPRREK